MRTLLTPVGAPNARRPHRPKARTDGAAKQRKPAANHHNASRPAPTTAGLLDRRPDRTRYPAIAFTSPTERAGEPQIRGSGPGGTKKGTACHRLVHLCLAFARGEDDIKRSAELQTIRRSASRTT